MDIKPIETSYKGYKFRSRLEARWAVFFDAAGLAWEYEPEGYVMSDGTCYLPDFYLPTEKIYVEVKGVYPDDTEKLTKFSIEKNEPILLVCGVLGEQGSYCDIFIPRIGDWLPCFLAVHPRKELIFLYGEGIQNDEHALEVIAMDYKKQLKNARGSAIKAMKSARFEFL